MAGSLRWGEGVRTAPRPPFTSPLLLANVFLLLLLLFFLFVPFTTASFDFVVRPEFGERPGDLNVTTFAGQTAHLPCTVKHLAGKRVSWIRGHDLQVLSTGRITFSTDVRISVLPGSSGRLKSRSVRSVGSKVEVVEVVEGQGTVSPRRGKVPLNASTSLSSSSTSASSTGNHEKEEEGGEEEKEEEDKEKGWKRQEEVVRHYSSSLPPATSTSTSPRSHTKTHPHPHKKPPHHSPHKTNTHPHHTHYHKHHQNPVTLPHKTRIRRRAPNWPAWTTDYFYYPFHHEEDTISGLGGSAAWFHRELARFNSVGSRGYTDQNPIAIYPQGPLSTDPHAKGQVPGPNYIEGVWEPEDYTLQIKYTEADDAGAYICQINTEPPITQVVRLSVVNMRAEIVGSRELYVKAGTPVTLACKVNHGKLMPGFILWYKGDRLVEYDTSGGRISVSTEPTGVSHLLLRHARPGDSANYTCSPSAGAPASLTLNVIVDERQAAMQQGNAAPPPPAPHCLLLPPALALVWGVRGGAARSVGRLGVVGMVGKIFLPTHLLPFLLLLLLLLLLLVFFLLFLVLCNLPTLCLERKGRFK